ncbi:fasciclin domain-containing protein [Maribacter sp. 2307ULW6-5]|uniref:fasciclin domain-containing protein n=1 Tax=Maribacter sp. 2307ULW6-5 TaxID=3386275 RepID=UPI0039BD61EA
MKKLITNLFATVLAMFLFSNTATAQWDGNDPFSMVDNTKMYTTLELASMDKNLSTFVNMVTLSGLAPSMLMTDDHTLFIPTNDAFKDMSIERYMELTDPKNQSELITFVKYHALPNKYMKREFKDDQVITDPSPDEITVSKDVFDNVYVGGAKIVEPNIEGSNGVIHIVNALVTPNKDYMLID